MSKIVDFKLREEEAGRQPSIPVSVVNVAETATKTVANLVEAIQPVSFIVSYWQLCHTVILAAGKVADKEKLILNYTNENTRHIVAPIVENKRYYPKGIESVRKARLSAMTRYYQAIDRLNEFAYEHNRDQVIPMKLLSLLADEDTRDKYKQRIKLYKEQEHPPIALDEIQL